MSAQWIAISLASALVLSVAPLLALRFYEGGLTPLSAVIAVYSITVSALAWAAVRVFTRQTGEPSSTLGRERNMPRNAFFNRLPDPLLEIDRRGRILFANEAALKQTGYAAAEVVGKRLYDFTPALTKDLSVARPCSILELPVRLKDGSDRFFEFSIALKDGDGASGYLCIGRDSDGRKRLLDELTSARTQAEETSRNLKKTVSDLEEFALLAVRREFKMQELRERFVQLKEEHEIKREFPG